MNNPLVSICIPCYKNASYLKRLLDSIAIQTYKDFEVIITDDSPDGELQKVSNEYSAKFNIRYIKNRTNLDTPENWNEGIRKAAGDWIKLMHDDDWFASPHSLQSFINSTRIYPDNKFYFSAYKNIYEDQKVEKKMFLNNFWKKKLFKDPNILIADNVIGPPSVIFHKNDGMVWYDTNMKYVVDIDFYIARLKNETPVYINEILINVGINNAQVTKYTFGIAVVHLKESLLLLQKTGAQSLNNIIVFDGWWRLMRNFNIRSEENLHDTGYIGSVPAIISNIIKFQKKIPQSILKTGSMSKLLMTVCFLKNNSLQKK